MNTAEVLNTPGYYYAIAYALSVFVITCTNERKIGRWKLAVVSCAQFALLLFFMTVTDGVRQELFVPSMLLIVLLLLGYIYICNDFSLREAGFYFVKAFINGEFAASLCWQIYYYLRYIRGIQGELLKWVELILVYAVIFTILALMELNLKKDLEELHITRRELLVVIIIAASVFAMSNLSYLDQNGLFSGTFVMDIFIIRTLVDLSGIAVLYAYHVQVKEIQIRFEKETLHNIMEMQYKNYQLSKENIDMVNRKYHDLKHQINLLKTQAYVGKSTSYLEKMEREIRVYETQNKTGNQILDAVLTNKAMICQNKEIELKFIVDGGALSFMEDMDVSALFGNMLDNAIESAEKQREKQKRLIWLYVTKEKQFVRIRTENYCDEKIQFKNGMPVTTKKDRRLHGYGMKSIKSTVEKYHGSVVAAQENNWFELKILLPAGG
ncbi:sensor histidine kinase [Blautia sp. 2744]|uniref:Sensor histidine kinase n=1 Tax=Blautia intestinalis TaxID=2763028 RepID=A0ABR7I3Q8_9FIRM|nr:ATP-binding protein [Blautia intestinalis]MBC5741147.1 sensor histidine kinase [Blautia intestinalis]RHD31113.1 ATP-binding protein [Blautia obeum]